MSEEYELTPKQVEAFSANVDEALVETGDSILKSQGLMTQKELVVGAVYQTRRGLVMYIGPTKDPHVVLVQWVSEKTYFSPVSGIRRDTMGAIGFESKVETNL